MTVISNPSIKITLEGVIITLKNIGVWLASYTISGIKSDPQSFIFALLIYALITVPSDLYALNHITTHAEEKALEKLKNDTG